MTERSRLSDGAELRPKTPPVRAVHTDLVDGWSAAGVEFGPRKWAQVCPYDFAETWLLCAVVLAAIRQWETVLIHLRPKPGGLTGSHPISEQEAAEIAGSRDALTLEAGEQIVAPPS